MSFPPDSDPQSSVSSPETASRFDPYFDIYGLSLKQQAGLENRTVTLIARSPSSPPAQALAVNLKRFQPLTVEVRIIFAQISPASALWSISEALSTACRLAPESSIRWAKNRALIDAHERLTLGLAICWTGDSMRRSEDSRSAINRVEDGTPSVIAGANASFEALWGASKPLPRTLFSRRLPNANPVLQAQPYPEMLTAEPAVIKLEDYVRLRRH